MNFIVPSLIRSSDFRFRSSKITKIVIKSGSYCIKLLVRHNLINIINPHYTL